MRGSADQNSERDGGVAFRPWRNDIFGGLVFSVAGGVLVLHLLRGHLAPVRDELLSAGNFALGASTILALYGLAMLKRGAARLRGKAVEDQAFRRIRRAAHKSVQVQQSQMTRESGADADILVYDPDRNERWVIEVKSAQVVEIKRGFFSTAIVRRGRGKIDPQQAIAQVKAVSAAFAAAPVLWFPLAKANAHTVVDGVLVVLGFANKPAAVLKAAGIRRRGWF